MTDSANMAASGLSEKWQKILDPEFLELYKNVLGPRQASSQPADISALRANPEKYRLPWGEDTAGSPGVEDVLVPSEDGFKFKVRVYTPDVDKVGPGPYPVHVNYHGGGFIFGDLVSDGKFCKYVRDTLGMVVVDVDYRLCPDHRYGKNIEDAWAALKWVHSNAQSLNIQPTSISIGGISAGACLSAVLQHLARDAGLNLKLAVLAVPPVDIHAYFDSPEDSKFESFKANSDAPALNWGRIKYFQQFILTPEHKDYVEKELPQWWRSPLLCKDFSNLCDTCVLTAECDPLRDEGEEYGRKLVQGGGKVLFRRYLGVPHPFMHLPLEKAHQYDLDVCDALYLAHGLKKRY